MKLSFLYLMVPESTITIPQYVYWKSVYEDLTRVLKIVTILIVLFHGINSMEGLIRITNEILRQLLF